MNEETRWRSAAAAIRREVTGHFPDWTDTNDHDPGVTLLNLFAWLTEQLLYRQSGADPQRIAAARRLAAAASAWVNSTCDADSEALLRVNYFDGKLLSADDLRDEQTYFRQRLRRINQRLHGYGVVSGLKVSIAGKGNAARIEVSPGVAIDPTGEDIVITSPVTLPLPNGQREVYVQLRWVERPCGPVPSPDDTAPTQYSRIADTWTIELAPAPAPHAVTLAHLKCVSGRWTRGRSLRRP
jgi:hypothetical protein